MHVTADATQFDPLLVAPVLAIPVLLLLLMILLVPKRRRKSREDKMTRRKEPLHCWQRYCAC